MVSFLPDSLRYRQMIAKATSDDEAPAPGYLHEELRQLTNDAEACRHIQDALLARLEIKSSNVKLKGLRTLKFLCQKGSPNLKRDLQRRTHVVRDCMHWRCDPHPTMGELPAKMVREAAQETVNAIFDSETPLPSMVPTPPRPSSSSTPTPAHVTPPSAAAGGLDKSRYGGFGRDTAPGGSGRADYEPDRSILSYASARGTGYGSTASSGGESRMGGFGNASAAQQGTAPMDLAMQAGGKAANMLSTGLSSLKDKVAGSTSHKGVGSSGQIYKTGGGSSSSSSSAQQGTPVWDPPPPFRPDPAPTPAAPKPSGVRVEAGSWEENLVEQITRSGGVRAVPGKDELEQLRNALTTSTDGGRLLQGLLLSKLFAEQWQARLKALHAFREMLRCSDSSVQEMIRKFLHNQIDSVQELTSSPHATLADLAGKVVAEVNNMTSASSSSAATAPHSSNLIDSSSPAQAGTGGLFDGLMLASDPKPPA
eukprot:CAMPEP_0173413394 /NCGR_PEP_ID=MMETSP1356-20130122/81877_1 /TAXON_ID=77927 ORGANISM="Hemiselmis virescens, Strain PCC157" /NCGR_SAMPLE_ID=MMETSP1356 /ASSEMBLY_ACC=CAM_ASM_000847 /LENGTH=479 /DNA_ID=CAMNT_0014375427 /DNA_START=118 /DNA_END=1554 /DNA_ORIENTATION=-